METLALTTEVGFKVWEWPCDGVGALEEANMRGWKTVDGLRVLGSAVQEWMPHGVPQVSSGTQSSISPGLGRGTFVLQPFPITCKMPRGYCTGEVEHSQWRRWRVGSVRAEPTPG